LCAVLASELSARAPESLVKPFLQKHSFPCKTLENVFKFTWVYINFKNTPNKEQEDWKLMLAHCATLPRRSRAPGDES
jgi:hypothetical protein